MGTPDGRPPARRRAREATRVKRRRAARVRRNRVMLAVAVAGSAGILAAWFPATDLLHQRAELAAASTQLSQLNRQNAALRHRETQLRTPATLGRIAQQQYDLVPPGEQAYQVLPASGSPSGGATLPSFTAAGNLLGPSRSSHRQGASGAPAGTSGGFLGRVLRTLEFWR